MNTKNILNTIVAASLASFLLTGCSFKNPFGIGYDKSACDEAKEFGVCGSPRAIHKYRDKIRQVQSDYFNAALDQQLFFAVNDKGDILVKEDRDGQWERYNISPWKKLIDKRVDDLKKREEMYDQKTRSISHSRINLSGFRSDIPVTNETDLSVKYQAQGTLIETRTKVGNIIRDNGLIQPGLLTSYVDQNNDLVAAHELFVVVKEPDWVVGEKTPKNVEVGTIPTPLSTDLLQKQNHVHNYQEDVIRTYNMDDTAGLIKSVNLNPELKEKEYKHDMSVINSFLQEDQTK